MLTFSVLVVACSLSGDITPRFPVEPKFKPADVVPVFKTEYQKALAEVRKREIVISVGAVSHLDTTGVTIDFKCDAMKGVENGIYRCFMVGDEPKWERLALPPIIRQQMPETYPFFSYTPRQT